MLCPNCNHPLRDQAKFCNNCGATIAPASVSAVAAPPAPGKAEPTGPIHRPAAAPALESLQPPELPLASEAALPTAEAEEKMPSAPLPPPAPDDLAIEA